MVNSSTVQFSWQLISSITAHQLTDGIIIIIVVVVPRRNCVFYQFVLRPEWPQNRFVGRIGGHTGFRFCPHRFDFPSRSLESAGCRCCCCCFICRCHCHHHHHPHHFRGERPPPPPPPVDRLALHHLTQLCSVCVFVSVCSSASNVIRKNCHLISSHFHHSTSSSSYVLIQAARDKSARAVCHALANRHDCLQSVCFIFHHRHQHLFLPSTVSMSTSPH